jgi:predicted nucleic acid-binding protein
VTLVDAGPLIAIIDPTDRDHSVCAETLRRLTSPLVTTWPSFTEALHVLGRSGWINQELLWRIVLRGEVILHELDEDETRRAYDLMKKYQDVPMDLADATLVSLAEALDTSCVFTLDSDFRIYKFKGRRAFDVVP